MADTWKLDLLRRAHDHLLDTQLILSEMNNGYEGLLAIELDKVVDIRLAVGNEIEAEQKKVSS